MQFTCLGPSPFPGLGIIAFLGSGRICALEFQTYLHSWVFSAPGFGVVLPYSNGTWPALADHAAGQNPSNHPDTIVYSRTTKIRASPSSNTTMQTGDGTYSNLCAALVSWAVKQSSKLKRLYVPFICPNLEHATAVWDPHLSKDIQKLESVQRLACRVCTKR